MRGDLERSGPHLGGGQPLGQDECVEPQYPDLGGYRQRWGRGYRGADCLQHRELRHALHYLRPGSAPFTADNIINWISGSAVTGMRNRNITVDDVPQVWKLGDIVNSTPVIVGGPKERYDVIYGDSTYTSYFTQYKNRRMVAYTGGNDGMLHAFNVGFYHRGDDPATSSATEHGWFTRR